MRWKEGVDPAVETGRANLDVGVARFAAGATVLRNSSMSFRNLDMFCVAPIVTPGVTVSDFWVAGKNCCNGRQASQFRCGDWEFPAAAGGLRVLSDHDSQFYQLAVQQAEAHYGFTSDHPVFFTWEVDPEQTVAALWWSAEKVYCAAVALFANVTIVAMGVAVSWETLRLSKAQRSQ
jgi:hypothetical protein